MIARATDFDPAKLRSNMFPMEWPPNTGKLQQFPEIDRAAWLRPEIAKRMITKGQVPLIDQLITIVNAMNARSQQKTTSTFSH